MSHGQLQIIHGNASRDLAKRIADRIRIPVTPAKVGRFPDGEIDVRVDENVRGNDVYLVQSTSPPVNDNLMELLILMDAVRRASASRITAVIPYFGYARKDRKDEGRVPITAKLVANLLTQAGAHRSRWTCTPRRSRASSTCRWTTSTRRRCWPSTSARCACPSSPSWRPTWAAARWRAAMRRDWAASWPSSTRSACRATAPRPPR
jgi:hypothetical protein